MAAEYYSLDQLFFPHGYLSLHKFSFRFVLRHYKIITIKMHLCQSLAIFLHWRIFFFFFLQLVTILQSNLNMVLYVDMCVYVFVLHHGCVMVSPLHFCALHCSQQKYVTEHIFYNLPFSSMGDFWGWDVCALVSIP